MKLVCIYILSSEAKYKKQSVAVTSHDRVSVQPECLIQTVLIYS